MQIPMLQLPLERQTGHRKFCTIVICYYWGFGIVIGAVVTYRRPISAPPPNTCHSTHGAKSGLSGPGFPVRRLASDVHLRCCYSVAGLRKSLSNSYVLAEKHLRENDRSSLATVVCSVCSRRLASDALGS